MAAAACALALCVVAAGFGRGGTPPGVTESFDCASRKHAYAHGRQTLPQRGDFRELYDALQLQSCGVPVPQQEPESWVPPRIDTPVSAKSLIFVDGSSSAARPNGSIAAPYKGLREGLDAVRSAPRPAAVLLREGHYFTSEIHIDSTLSNVTIQAYEGERVTLSGSLGLETPADGWEKHRVEPASWVVQGDANNVYGQVTDPGSDTETVKFIGEFDSESSCFDAATRDSRGFLSATWHPASIKGYGRQCFAKIVDYWAPYVQKGVMSARFISYNLWKIDLKKFNPGANLEGIEGLRVNGERAVRAKYPDGNPEQSGTWFDISQTPNQAPSIGQDGQYSRGWIFSETRFSAPTEQDVQRWGAETTDYISTNASFPGVYWPMSPPEGFDSTEPGIGDWGHFITGSGPFCQNMHPKTGYFCTQNNSRQILPHLSPFGLDYSNNLPQAVNYTNVAGAVFNGYISGGRLYNNLCRISHNVKENTTLMFDLSTGCNQGAYGNFGAAQWFIENVLEECDSPGEFYFDRTDHHLYYAFNTTETPSDSLKFVAATTKVLLNVTGSTPLSPVTNFAVRGITIRDTRLTYLGDTVADNHGIPSGGDWALGTSGAVTLRNTVNATISDCLFTRIDGYGVYAGGFHRGLVIRGNEFSWIGESAIAAWGDSSDCFDEKCSVRSPDRVGPDTRNGEQPRGSLIEANVMREIGIWEKQSAMYFQAVTMQTMLRKNVLFNSPRACINLNDGAGGGDVIEHNLILNCVRETADHGPINTWNRLPYITDVGMLPDATAPLTGGATPGHKPANGTASILPFFRTVRNNFVLGTYVVFAATDNDDGSTRYLQYNNYFVYGALGLKSDFNAGWKHHYNNVYAYVEACFSFVFNAGTHDAFYNNTCQTLGTYFNPYPSTCDNRPFAVVRQNSVYAPPGPAAQIQICDGDVGTTVGNLLTDEQLQSLGEAALRQGLPEQR